MAVSRSNELRADLKVTGAQQFKRDMHDAGDSAKRAGDNLEEMAKDAGFLTKSIAAAKAEIADLVQQLDATGDMTLLKPIRVEQRSLRLFEKLYDQIKEPVQEAGESAGRLLTKSIGEGLNAGPAMKVALGGIAVLLAPLIGATVGAAVLGGVGLGGIAGGIAMSVQDPRVHDAAKDLAATVGEAFKDAGEPFAAPVAESLKILKNEGVSAAGQFADAFKVVAPIIPQFAAGLGGLVREFMPGFTKGLEAAKPLLRVLAAELPEIGAALGDFIATIGEDSDGATQALTWLFTITKGTIRGLGELIAFLSRTYKGMVEFGTGSAEVLANLTEGIPFLGDHFRQVADTGRDMIDQLEFGKDASHDFAGGIGDIGDSTSRATEELEAMKLAMDDLFGRTMSLHQAQIAYEKSLDETTKILKEGIKTLNADTEAGRENRGAMLDRIEAINELRAKSIEHGMAVEDANRIYDEQLEKLRSTAIQIGFNRSEVNQLIDAYDNLPRLVELQLTVKGLSGAKAQIEALANLLGSKAGAKASLEGTYVSGRASGGDVRAGKTYLVGEKGPELVTFGSDGWVHDADKTAAMMSSRAGHHGGGGTMTAARPVLNMTVMPSGNPAFDALVQALWPFILHQVRVDGGDLAAFGAE